MGASIDRAIDAARSLDDREPPWRDLIGGACDQMGATGGVFILFEDKKRVLELQDYGTDAAAVRDYTDHFHAKDILLPWSDSPAGTWVDTERVFSSRELGTSEYYTDFMCRHRMRQIVCHFLESDSRHTATISFQREHAIDARKSQAILESAPVREFLRAAQNTLRRRRERATAWLSSIDSAFERFNEGVALIDLNGCILQLSACAAAQLGGHGAIKVRAGRLWHPNERVRRILEGAIARVGLGAQLGPIVVPSAFPPGSVHTLQFVLADGFYLASRRQVILCRIKRHDQDGPAPALRAFAAVYELSEAELKVLEALVAGKSAQEVADESMISVNNVRKRIATLMEKTGCSRQSLLVKLAVLGH